MSSPTRWPGRPCSAEDDDYEVELTYGVLGLGSNVYEEKQSYATGTAYLKTVTRKYDAVGNKTSETYPSGLALTYTWTDVRQLDTITDGTSTLADYAYAGLRRKDLVLGNSSKTVFSYSGFRGEVATIDHQDNASSTVLRLDYGYNKVHDRTCERYGSSGSAGDAFEYDKARRLTVAWMGSSTPSSPSGNTYVRKIEYGMDDDGNRTTVTVTPYGSSPTSTSYTDNNLNQYTAVGGVSRSHDGNGNVSDDGTYTYIYNYKNLIVKATRKSDSAVVGEYKYDALGRRVEKVVTGATYRYIYSGVETVSVYTSTGTWKQDYVYGPGIDEVLMLEQADVLDWDGDSNTSELARSWYRANALGSVMRIEEQDRTESVSYRYDPYGEVAITRGGSAQGSDPLGQYVTYTGRWRDEETGLYHNRARTYDPLRGRFLERDPLGTAAGSNLYEYCGSQPSVMVDPLGLDGFKPPPVGKPSAYGAPDDATIDSGDLGRKPLGPGVTEPLAYRRTYTWKSKREIATEQKFRCREKVGSGQTCSSKCFEYTVTTYQDEYTSTSIFSFAVYTNVHVMSSSEASLKVLEAMADFLNPLPGAAPKVVSSGPVQRVMPGADVKELPVVDNIWNAMMLGKAITEAQAAMITRIMNPTGATLVGFGPWRPGGSASWRVASQKPTHYARSECDCSNLTGKVECGFIKEAYERQEAAKK